jgi:putative membrane protein
MLAKLLIRWFIVAVSLGVAVWIIPGISVQDSTAWVAVAVMAIVLGLANAIIRPILAFLSCGLIVVTMGLFMIVINAFTLWFSSWILTNWLSIGFHVEGILAALAGGLVVSIVSFVLSMLLKDD